MFGRRKNAVKVEGIFAVEIDLITERRRSPMEWQAFGAILRSLRLEHHDLVHDWFRGWSRQRLSAGTDKAGPVALFADAIGKIERGERHHLRPEELTALATALHLTTAEVERFFWAANGVSSLAVAAGDRPTAEQRLDRLLGLLTTLSMPWFVYDQYGDVVCAGRLALALFGIGSGEIAAGHGRVATFNIMRALFDLAIGLQQLLGQHELAWRRVLLANVLYFRALLLPYRGEPYARSVLADLRTLPGFAEVWDEAYARETDFFGLPPEYRYDHPDWGALHYTAQRTLITMPAGPLVAVVYLPQDEATADAFAALHRSLPDGVCRRLAPWPEKPGPAVAYY